MKTQIEKIWNEITKNRKITILTHVDPDGDTIGSALALKELIELNSQNIEVKISGDKAPRYLSKYDKQTFVDNNFFNESQVIVVDTSTKARIFDKRVRTKESIKIDHHHHEGEWKLEIGGDHWPATGELIYEFIDKLNLKYSKLIMESIFVAIWTDTEGLTQRNISKRTREIMAILGKYKDEVLNNISLISEEKEHIAKLKKELRIQNNVCSLITQEYVPNDYLRQMVGEFSNGQGFEIFFGVTKDKKGYRGEIRSKGNVDVSKFAKYFGGGGHHSSAGFRVDSLEQAHKNLEYILSSLKIINT